MPSPIPTFTLLSPCTSIYIPPSMSTASPPTPSTITPPPYLILLCTHLNASTAHIRNYTTGYKRLFPTSRILLVTTSSAHFLSYSSARWMRELDPAVRALSSLSPHGGSRGGRENEKVLTHVVSTGGATAAVRITEAYRELERDSERDAEGEGRGMPVHKMLLDSCPGVEGYESAVGAFEVGFIAQCSSGGLWGWVWGRVKSLMLGRGLRILFRVWFLIERLTGTENVVGVVRKKLNDKTLFRGGATRMYIYGGKDELVHAQDVEEHADEAERRGYEVLRIRYGDSGHAEHLLHDEGRYWASVSRLWDSGFLSGPGMVVCAW